MGSSTEENYNLIDVARKSNFLTSTATTHVLTLSCYTVMRIVDWAQNTNYLINCHAPLQHYKEWITLSYTCATRQSVGYTSLGYAPVPVKPYNWLEMQRYKTCQKNGRSIRFSMLIQDTCTVGAIYTRGQGRPALGSDWYTYICDLDHTWIRSLTPSLF